MPVGGMCVAKFVSRTQVYETPLVRISPGKHRLCQGGLTDMYETSLLHSFVVCIRVVSLICMRPQCCIRSLASGRHLCDTARLVYPSLRDAFPVRCFTGTHPLHQGGLTDIYETSSLCSLSCQRRGICVTQFVSCAHIYETHQL